MRLSERLGSLVERQKADLQFYGGAGEQAPPGRFKVSAQIIKVLEKDAPDAWKDEMGRVDITQVLFKEQQNLLRAIPREDLPALVGADNIPDAQDVLANKPREAFKLMLRNITKVSPKAAKLMRAVPENVALYWYLIMARLSGRDMADDLFKKYFSTAQGGKAFGQAQKKFKAVAEGREGEDEGEGEAMGDEGVCPVTGEPRPCEARDRTDGASCEACEGPEDDDEEMDAEEASEAVGHWVAALMEAAAKKRKASKQQQLSAKYINPKTGAFKGRKGEKFGNCVKYMKAKGGISDPKALCGTIARKKAGAMGEAAEPAIHDIIVAVADPKLSMKEAQAALKAYGLPRIHPMAVGSRKWFKLDAVAAGLRRLQRDKRFEVREAGTPMGEAAGERAPNERMLEGAAKAAFRRAGMSPWAEGTSKEWLVFVNTDHGPAADSQAFVTLWKGRKGWQLISGVPQAAEDVLLASPSAMTSGQSAKKHDALLAAADGKRALNQNYLLAVAKEVEGDRFLAVQQRMGRVIDIGPKGGAMGEASGWGLTESDEADPRKMIESGGEVIKLLEGHLDALRKGVAAAQAELKGYARVGVPGRGAAVLLKKHLLFPAERMEDMAKKVRETIEEGIKVFE
jgi:hypothetical protein